MIRFKDVQIPKPCSIDYDSLTGDEVKRFCDSCEKPVYDFRKKDDIYFDAIFKKQKTVCGIFYEDQLSNRKTKSNSFFYNYVLMKIISLLLFIKTFLVVHETKAITSFSPKVNQTTSTDSTAIKTVYKNVTSRTRHTIKIYVNNELIIEHPSVIQEFIYLPDSLKPNDKIKVKVSAPATIRTKTYYFKYSEAENITIKITKKHTVRLFKRRYRIGCPSQFW